MPRPTSKTQLLEQTRTNYAALQKEITPLSPDERVEGGMVGEWSVKDVLVHLTVWQQMVCHWYKTGKQGEIPITPSENFTWREIPALNQHIYEQGKDRPLAEVEADFTASHETTLTLIETMTDEELFTPKVYAWTKSTTLGSYLTSATSSHYDWARKEIHRGIKNKRRNS